MPTPAELTLMNTRRNAARSATKFFKDIKGVKSTNNPFAHTTHADIQNLVTYRTVGPNTIVDRFNAAATTGVGNCDEKGRICYAALTSNPLLNGSVVTFCAAVNYDHVFVVVANAAVGAATNLAGLGLTAMIVDGWTEDWYFPNLGWLDAKMNGLGNTPNPRQLYVRLQIEAHQLENYGHVPNF
jgi:hypothetical protein